MVKKKLSVREIVDKIFSVGQKPFWKSKRFIGLISSAALLVASGISTGCILATQNNLKITMYKLIINLIINILVLGQQLLHMQWIIHKKGILVIILIIIFLMGKFLVCNQN
ncbi:hypothetical protein [Spiroplasma endosymbiont of Glossina fuscipes fuscipes]|uniref:hypothetical protein n=1 Tax=Spiroplasma endosymbiont of Glossina fuscipes fuscipes TaxID=2004463 RepID=UPI003CF75159